MSSKAQKTSAKFRVQTSWPGLTLDVPEEEYAFYQLLDVLVKRKFIDILTFLTAEREMILKGYVLAA